MCTVNVNVLVVVVHIAHNYVQQYYVCWARQDYLLVCNDPMSKLCCIQELLPTVKGSHCWPLYSLIPGQGARKVV